jgi:hypothetical protein
MNTVILYFQFILRSEIRPASIPVQQEENRR